MQQVGIRNLSNADLLALLIRTGSSSHSASRIACDILAKYGGLRPLSSVLLDELMTNPGIGQVKGSQLLAAFEIGRRLSDECITPDPILSSPENIAAYLRPRGAALSVEKFWTLCLNTKKRLIRCIEITSGTATCSLAHPREVLRTAIKLSASAIIVAHNHPSGDPEPSSADHAITKQIRDAAKVAGIDLLDHVILGTPAHDPSKRGYFSFRLAGLL
jgi:DNA repair protein RadC